MLKIVPVGVKKRRGGWMGARGTCSMEKRRAISVAEDLSAPRRWANRAQQQHTAKIFSSVTRNLILIMKVIF